MPELAIRYVLANPSGNTTLLVLDPVDKSQYVRIAQGIMDNYNVEQVGFATEPHDTSAAGRVEMMGGEFCGNASRCLAAWLAMSNDKGELCGLAEPKKKITIEISGYNGTLTASVKKANSFNACKVKIGMPLPSVVRHGSSVELGAYSLVAFEGITHVILWEREPDKKLAPFVGRLASMHYSGCFGMLFTDIEKGRMTPLVYVKDTNSLIFEGSCGSGTVAVACAIAQKTRNKITHIKLVQPGGTLGADAKMAGQEIGMTSLSGEVSISSSGKLYIKL